MLLQFIADNAFYVFYLGVGSIPFLFYWGLSLYDWWQYDAETELSRDLWAMMFAWLLAWPVLLLVYFVVAFVYWLREDLGPILKRIRKFIKGS